MPFKWSPPQRKKLTKGGSEALLTSSSSLTSNTSNVKKTTNATNNTQQYFDDNYLQLKQQQQQHNSVPLKLGNTKFALKRATLTDSSASSSMQSLCSTNSTKLADVKREKDDEYELLQKIGHHYNNYHHTHSSVFGRGGSSTSSNESYSGSNRFGGSSTSKRGKKQMWGSRERAGMSFLIVIAFFAVFGLIVLMELFMIDDRSHTGMMALRHGNNFGSRSGDSMPDYDNVKDDYDLLDENLLTDSKLGFVQFRDNKLKIQDADGDGNGRVAGALLNAGSVLAQPQRGAANADGVSAVGAARPAGMGTPIIPWGKILPAKVEETLPHFPIGVQPNDGAWQVVNGTRFKFFVFSAYYDRRDGAKLVRVIGATKTRTPERVWCRFWYPQQTQQQQSQQQQQPQHTSSYTSATVMARVKVIRENWNLKYSAVFVLCPVRPAELEVPHYVSIVARLRAPPGNLLQLRNTDWDPDFAHLRKLPVAAANSSVSAAQTNASAAQHLRQRQQPQYHRPVTMSPAAGAQYLPFGLPTDEQIPDKIAVCVKPFHFNYDQALYLMEFLEFYALMGVAHFTFYNHTLGPHATCVLQHYIDGDIPNTSTAWDVDLAEVMGKGVTLMGHDAAKVDAVLSGYYNLNSNNNYNKDNDGNNFNRKINNKREHAGNQTGVANSETTQQTQKQQTIATTLEREVTGALQPPPPPPPAPAEAQQQQQAKPPLQTTLPPVKRYKSTQYAKPTINILPWNLRMRSQKEIRTEGLFAALNDCLYRTMHRYRYLAMVDLDEFIVPRHNDTLNELINSLNHRFRYRNLGAYSFQNAFFYLQFPDDPLVTLAHSQPQQQHSREQQPYAHTNPGLRASLVTQRKTRRRLKLHPQKQRSKYICKPESVIEAGNHFVWEFSPAKGSLNVPPTDGILQHYRVCEFGGNDCIKTPSVVDRTATKYVNRLVERVELVYKHLKQRCDLPPLPNEPPAEQQQQPQSQQQQRKQQSQSTGELFKADVSAKGLDSKTNNNNNNNNNSHGVSKKRAAHQSDDERIKTLANVKSKRDNDRENNSNFRNSGTTIHKTAALNNLNSIDPTPSAVQMEYKVKRKKRKVVVFEQDEDGLPIARLEYVDE
ncbi:uncharacterized protein LOC120769816 isoform X1 [Bactrocera tryoni]|uniref:uncharacterized protein LOC120769816 isoform X1 n=1 Tax=Bactrocera tryoni TaxID=59916 RepID=UPI001A962ED5|nr:uncharacterized protein LOC120769816 isoform X1 [Bactrocera tryoni]